MISSMGFLAFLRRDLRLINRRRGEVASPLIFFLMTATFVPLGITPDAELLKNIAPGIIWAVSYTHLRAHET